MDRDELRAKLTELQEDRETAERELRALEERRERLEQMERDRDAVLETYAGLVPQALDALTWLDRLADVERKRASFQDMAAEGLITFDELRAKLAALEETRQTARRELAALEARTERLQALERDREALLEDYA